MNTFTFVLIIVGIVAFTVLLCFIAYRESLERMRDKEIKQTAEEKIAEDIHLIQRQVETIQFDLLNVKELLTERGMLFKKINDNVETLNQNLSAGKKNDVL